MAAARGERSRRGPEAGARETDGTSIAAYMRTNPKRVPNARPLREECMPTNADTAVSTYPLSLGAVRHALEEIAEKVGELQPTAQVRQLELQTEKLRREARLVPAGSDARMPALIDAAVALESEVATLWRQAGHARASAASTLVPG